MKRYPGNISRMTMLVHNASNENPDLQVSDSSKMSIHCNCLQDMMERSESKKLLKEGISSLRYNLESIKRLPLFTRIRVYLPRPRTKAKPGWLENIRRGYSGMRSAALNRFASSLTATTPLDSVDGSVDERPYHLRISLQDVHRPIDERGQQVQMKV